MSTRARRNKGGRQAEPEYESATEWQWPIFEWGVAPHGAVTRKGAKTTARGALDQVFAAIGRHPLLGVFAPTPERSPFALVAFWGEAEVYDTLGPMEFAQTPTGGAWGYLRVLRVDLDEALQDSDFTRLWAQRT